MVISQALAAEIATRQVLRYASYCYDSESGMYYLSSRHYDPATRQFLSKDLSRNDGEQSAYGYCLGNPVKNIDPTGYAPTAAQWEAYRKMAAQYRKNLQIYRAMAALHRRFKMPVRVARMGTGARDTVLKVVVQFPRARNTEFGECLDSIKLAEKQYAAWTIGREAPKAEESKWAFTGVPGLTAYGKGYWEIVGLMHTRGDWDLVQSPTGPKGEDPVLKWHGDPYTVEAFNNNKYGSMFSFLGLSDRMMLDMSMNEAMNSHPPEPLDNELADEGYLAMGYWATHDSVTDVVLPVDYTPYYFSWH